MGVPGWIRRAGDVRGASLSAARPGVGACGGFLSSEAEAVTFYRRAVWLDRLTGIQWIWLAEPFQPWLPGIPKCVVVPDRFVCLPILPIDERG